MSVSVQILLYCDGNDEDCPRNGECFGDGWYKNFSQIREHAKNCGWVKKGGKDFCPDCAPKPIKAAKRCACACHKPGAKIMHCVPCC